MHTIVYCDRFVEVPVPMDQLDMETVKLTENLNSQLVSLINRPRLKMSDVEKLATRIQKIDFAQVCAHNLDSHI